MIIFGIYKNFYLNMVSVKLFLLWKQKQKKIKGIFNKDYEYFQYALSCFCFYIVGRVRILKGFYRNVLYVFVAFFICVYEMLIR